MSDPLPTATQYLLSHGWQPIKVNVHPQDTAWKRGSAELSFIDAYLEQCRIDNAVSAKLTEQLPANPGR